MDRKRFKGAETALKIADQFLCDTFQISPAIAEFVEKTMGELQPQFAEYQEICEINSYKVIRAFRDCGVSSRHFYGTTGYGYSDEGREKLGEVFAEIFGAESALVSPLISSGTHAINIALFGLLRPLDTLFSITGRPYDTLSTAIGLDGEEGNGSLRDFAVQYRQCDLINGRIDIDTVLDTLYIDKKIKIVYIQRSRGYELRPAIRIDEIAEVIRRVKEKFPEVYIVVDNCYGEFCETREPTEVGADVIIGSLIKNPGAGIAPTGAYIAGTQRAIRLISQRMTCAGIGDEIGSYLAGYLPFFQGIYFAPGVVKNALCGATLSAAVFSKLGYEVFPTASAKRSDITQAILTKTENELVELIRAVQQASPIDSNVVPYPWDMPGYQDKVIMAAGSFIQGSSIELSADAPIKKPYVAYFQGGLTLENIKLALMLALTYMKVPV